MPWKRIEILKNRGWLCCQHMRGETACDLVSLQKFGMEASDGLFVRGNDAIIAARERAGPGLVWAKLFVMVEHLARQREQRAHGFAAGKSGVLEDLDSGFFEREEQARGKRSSSVIGDFIFLQNIYGNATERAGDGTRHANRGGIAFNTEDFSFQRRDAEAVEGLQRVHGGSECATGAHGLQGGGAARPAGVQDDFVAQELAADASKLRGGFWNGVIGNGDQNYFRGEGLMRDVRQRHVRRG